MSVLIYFDVPPEGLTKNREVADEWARNASGGSPTDAADLTFALTADHLVVEWDVAAADASESSKDALRTAVENQYGVSHRTTEEG